MSPTNNKKLFFPNLDGLRFIAFLMVFLWHTSKSTFKMMNIQHRWVEKLFYFLINGSTGVSIFFVLSGFLITYLILTENDLYGRLDIIKFYIRRILRIWPLYFLTLLLIFAVFPFIVNLSGFEWEKYSFRPWFYFLFISNFDVMHISAIKGKELLSSAVTWSIAIEEQFYLVWPLLFTFVPGKFYKYIFPAIVAVSYIFRSFYANNFPVLYYHTLSVCGDLALGAWMAWLSFTKKEFVSIFENQSNNLRLVIYTVSLAAIYLFYIHSNNFTNVFGRLVQGVFICYIILDQNFSGQNFLKCSNNSFISFWGKYTYGLYLWHPIVLYGVGILFTRVFHPSWQNISNRLIMTSIGLAGSFLISYLSYHFFELYFLNLKKDFTLNREFFIQEIHT